MAQNGCESVRNSIVPTEMQGYLEKKGLLGNKSKMWCKVDNSTLVIQKKQGENKTVNLKDSLIRKVVSDVSGTQFEIYQKKKTRIFVCPTSDICTAWVRSLHAAMAQKNCSQYDSDPPQNADEEATAYCSINYQLNSQKSTHASVKLSEYEQPKDTQKKISLVLNEYWEIGHTEGKMGNTHQSPAEIANGCESDSLKPNVEENVYSDATSETVSTRFSSRDIVSSKSQETAEQKTIISHINNYVQNSIHPQISINITSPEPDLSDDTHGSDEDENVMKILNEILSVDDSPVPDFIHPLTDEDWKPFEDLSHFLDNNTEFCRVSYSLIPLTEDPVSSLKFYLETAYIHTGH